VNIIEKKNYVKNHPGEDATEDEWVEMYKQHINREKNEGIEGFVTAYELLGEDRHRWLKRILGIDKKMKKPPEEHREEEDIYRIRNETGKYGEMLSENERKHPGEENSDDIWLERYDGSR